MLVEGPPAGRFWEKPLAELIAISGNPEVGLGDAEAEALLRRYGPNVLAPEPRLAGLKNFLRLLGNPLILVLLGASAISLALGDRAGGLIIIAMVLLSVLLNFVMEFRARHAIEAIRLQTATLASVRRGGEVHDVPAAELVPGDVIELHAGDLIPADARLLQTKDLHVRESALTGESLPVGKQAGDLEPGGHELAEATNSVFMGTAVQSGMGRALVVRTGARTAFGEIGASLAARPPETELDQGLRRFGMMIMRIIMGLVLFVLIVNILSRRPLLDSFLFAIALAVGMTPELMPMIVTVTLAQAARRMMRRKVLVKQLAAIENFGSIEILCSDKTGTLTEGEIILDRHVDIAGNEDPRVLEYIYVNSALQGGIRSPLDDAVLRHVTLSTAAYRKVDEIPFDFARRRLSVVVARNGEYRLLTKGESESVMTACTQVLEDGVVRPFDAERRDRATATATALGESGFRTLGVALRAVPQRESYETETETDMTFAGFAAFFDPPRDDAAPALKALRHNRITVTLMTGDNLHVTRKVAADVGLVTPNFLTGDEIDGLDDAALAVQAERGATFVRVTPEQKNRIILALKARGRVVGYLGDGINDAPSLHSADVGISVMNGVEVAKDAAKIILLEKDLSVLNEGVLEGRRCYANVMKYIIMGTSSNFGNMFSMAAASIFLPFLPMLPRQVLLNNLLYDFSQVTLPADNVDAPLMRRPKRWRISFIRQFMLIVGPISSLYDFIIFAVLLWGFDAWHHPALFQTGWFVESLATQTLVVFVIRTAGNPLRSRPSPWLALTVCLIVAVAVALPWTPLAGALGFTPPPPILLLIIAALAATYLLLVQAVKFRFYRRHALL